MEYRDLAERLLASIKGGAFQVGHPIPTESSLAEDHGVSRNTVRAALAELQKLGYLARRQGARTILISKEPGNALAGPTFSAGEFSSFGQHTKVSTLSVESVVADAALARLLGVQEHAIFKRVANLHTKPRDRQPVCYSEVYVPIAYADVVEGYDGRESLFQRIEQRHGLLINRVSRAIEPIALELDAATRLGVPEGEAAMRVLTAFRAISGEVAEVAVAYFAKGKYRFEQEYRRSGR